MIFDEITVIEEIQKHLKPCDWVKKAREEHEVLAALIVGENFNEVLIKKIEQIESDKRSKARKKYSKDIRDLFDRVTQPRHSIFSASGGSVHIDIPSKVNKEKLVKSLQHFKGQKSIKQYLSENFFKLADVDPNGVLFLEYKDDEDIYPTYKSIKDIRYYESNGQLCEYIVFEPQVKVINGVAVHKWRLVDSETDWTIIQINNTFKVSEEKTFKHPFGGVPCVILSDIQKTGSELRFSSMFPIIELSKDYARDKSIKTIYKFQHGFPRHWRYVKECRSCQGTGKDGEHACKICNGKGEIRVNDITDVTTLPMPREDDQVVTPNVEGFVSPDLQTWTQYNDDLTNMEELIDATIWGTRRIAEGGNETATGRFIDVQPVMNKLGWYADKVEFTHNVLANFVNEWVQNKVIEKKEYHLTYGRRFIIESPDTVLEKYTEAREKGDNVTILDKLLDEYILSKYSNDPMMLEIMQKKRQVEPYVHNSIKEVSDIFGAQEAYKKVLFVDWWTTIDQSKTVDQLRNEFATYSQSNQLNNSINE